MIQQGTSLADRCGKEDDPPNETLNTDRQKAGGRLALRYAIFLSVIIDPRLTFHQRSGESNSRRRSPSLFILGKWGLG